MFSFGRVILGLIFGLMLIGWRAVNSGEKRNVGKRSVICLPNLAPWTVLLERSYHVQTLLRVLNLGRSVPTAKPLYLVKLHKYTRRAHLLRDVKSRIP